MALALNDRVQQTGTANTTVSFTLSGSVPGFQSFAVIGNGNTTYYSATDASGSWEVGIGTYSTTGPTLTRTTILSSSNSNTAVTFSGVVNVFVTYPAEKSINQDESNNVFFPNNLYFNTGAVFTNSVPIYGGSFDGNQLQLTNGGGAELNSLRDGVVKIQTGTTGSVAKTFTFDINGNLSVNRLNQTNTSTTAAGGVTALTTASSYIHTLAGTGSQTYTMPDATTLTTGVAFLFNNMATGTLTIQDYASGVIGTIPSGGAGAVFLTINATVGGTWDLHSYLPEGVTWGTNALNLGTAIVSGGTWQGGTIQPAYGGTGLTTFVGANNALYSSGASTLTAGTLPIAAGGTGATTDSTARTNLGATTVGSNLFTLTNPSAITFPRFNADNTVSALNASDFRTAIGAGTSSTTGTVTSVAALTLGTTGTDLSSTVATGTTTPVITLNVPTASATNRGVLSSTDWSTFNGKGSGTVTSVGGTGTVNGITLTGTVTSSGNLTLGGTLSGVSLSTQVTGTLPIANGGTGETTRQNAMDALAGAVTSGQYLRGNGTDVVMSAIQAADVPTLNQNTTGSSGSCTGNAATATTATTATNQSGGTVNATGITFTGTQIITNGAASTYGATSIRGVKNGWSGVSFYDSSNVFCNTLMARSSDGYGGIYNKAENNWLIQWDGSGNVTATANVTAYSDERLKKNWRPVQDNFVEKLAQVKSGIYDRTDMEVTQAGVSAQDMQKLLAETVQTGEDGTLSLAYGNAALVAAIELAKQVVELKKEIELLKAK